jgi:hypothetical protein
MRTTLLVLGALALLVPPCRADESPATTTTAALLRSMPRDLLDHAGGAYPDANGMVGRNRDGGFKAAALQRGATLKLAIHAARGEREKTEQCWNAVEATFAHQTPQGDFGDPPTSVAFWLCELNRALLVIAEGPLAADFNPRIEALKPKITRAAEWLLTQEGRLMKEDAHAPNRLFFDAEALLFTGKLVGDPDGEYGAAGRRFLAAGMKLFRQEDGVFLEHDGADSSYQAVNLLRLQEILIRIPDERITSAVERGMAWELSRVGPDGTIATDGNTRVHPGGEKFMGVEKQVNVGEVALAMLYYHARTGDARALEAARKVIAAASKAR